MMIRSFKLCMLATALSAFILFDSECAAQVPPASAPVSENFQTPRKIYVPLEFLPEVLSRDTFEAVLSQSEYDSLVQRAQAASDIPQIEARLPVLENVSYQVTQENGVLKANVRAEVTTFVAGSELSLPVTGWNVLALQLNNQSAIAIRSPEQLDTVKIYVPDSGQHELSLSLTTSMQTSGSHSAVSLSTLGAATQQFEITLPAEQTLTLNNQSLSSVAETPEVNTYSLPVGGLSTLNLLISDEQADDNRDSLNFATTSYQVSVTPGTVFWNSRTSLQIYGNSIQSVVFRIPSNVQLTSVEAEGLERWELNEASEDDTSRLLTMFFQNTVQGSQSISLNGLFSVPISANWSVPTIQIMENTSHIGQIMVQYPEQIRLQPLESSGVQSTMPEIAVRAAISRVIPVSSLFYEIWKEDFQLSFQTSLKEAQVQAAITSLLDIKDSGLDLSATMTLQTRQTPLFEVHIRLPADFQIRDVLVDEQVHVWRVTSDVAGVNEIRIPLTTPIQPGQSRTIAISASCVPDPWPVTDQSARLLLPEIRLPQAGMVEGLYGITAENELELIPVELNGLDPAPRNEIEALNQKLEQTGKHVRIGLTFQDSSYQGQLDVSRRGPVLNVQTRTFFRVDPQSTFTRFEANLQCQGGGLQALTIQASESVPVETRFSLKPLHNTASSAQIIQQIPGPVAEGMRTWTLQFDRRLIGEYLLTTECIEAREEGTTLSPAQFSFPTADGQSGFVAVEASPDEHVVVTAMTAEGVPLPQIDPIDFPAAIYTPQQRVVSGYRYHRTGWTLQVVTTQFEEIPIPTAVGHTAQLQSVINESGVQQHEMTLKLNASGIQGLLIKLPEDAKLWSVLLNQKPTIAQQSEEGIRVPLEQLSAETEQLLTLIFETPQTPLKPLGSFQFKTPAISVITGSGEHQPMPVLEQHWTLHYPESSTLLKSSGDFRPATPLESNKSQRLTTASYIPSFFQAISILIVLGIATVVMTCLVSLWKRRHFTFLAKVSMFFASLLAVFFLSFIVLYSLPVARVYRVTVSETSPQIKAPADNDLFFAEPAPAAAPTSNVIPEVEVLQNNNHPPAQIPSKAYARHEGLLSLPFSLEVPQKSRQHSFVYRGEPASQAVPALKLKYLEQSTSRMIFLSIVTGILLLGWFFRSLPALIKWWGIFLMIVLPLSLLMLVPYFYQIVLSGILAGGVLVGIGWGFRALRNLADQCKINSDAASVNQSVSVTGILMLCTLMLNGQQLEAADKPAPEPQTPYVIVPYESLEDLSSAQRVWVPAALYKQLWQAAHPEKSKTFSSGSITIVDANYTARIEQVDQQPRLLIQARWGVASLESTQQKIKVPLQSGQIIEAQQNGSPVPLIQDDNGLWLMISDSGFHVVDAEIVLPLSGGPLNSSFELDTLPVAAGTLTLELPESDHAYHLTVHSDKNRLHRFTPQSGEKIEIPVDHGGRLQFRWQAEQTVDDSQQLVQAENVLLATLDDSGWQFKNRTLIRPRQGAISQLSFDLPDSLQVRNVTGDEVSDWKRQQDGENKTLIVFFQQPVHQETIIEIDLYQKQLTDHSAQSVEISQIVPTGAQYLSGFFGITAADHLQTQTTLRERSPQIATTTFAERSRFNRDLNSLNAEQAYQIPSASSKIEVEALRKTPEVNAVIEHGAYVTSRKIMMASHLNLTLTGAPQRFVQVQIPENYLINDVACESANDWHVHSQNGSSKLTIELQKPTQGNLQIQLTGSIVRKTDESQIQLDFPKPTEDWKQLTRTAVWFDDIYEAILSQPGNSQLSGEEALSQELRALHVKRPQFILRSQQPVEPIAFQVKRSQAQMTAEAASLIVVNDSTVDYGFTFRWNVTQAATDSLTLTAPDWLKNLQFSGAGIRQVGRQPLPDGSTRWNISLLDPAHDQLILSATTTLGIPADQKIVAPVIQFEAFQTNGEYLPLVTQRQVAVLVNRSSSQLIRSDAAQFRVLAIEECPLKVPVEISREAMEIVQVSQNLKPVWELRQLEDVAGGQAVVVTATLNSNVELDGTWRMQAEYAIRNRGRQFLGLLLPEDSKVLSVFVRGQPGKIVTTQTENGPVALIALPQTSQADLSFDVVVQLAGRLEKSLPEQLALPQNVNLPCPQVITPEESADFGLSVAQTLWKVTFPKELIVRPLKDIKVSNLTVHQDDKSAYEHQKLTRYEYDVKEMSRILTDEQTSSYQRHQARQNLLQIEQQLEQITPSESRDSLQRNQKLFETTRNAIELYESSELDGRQAGASAQSDQSQIESLNEAIVSSNSIAPSNSSRQKGGFGFQSQQQNRSLSRSENQVEVIPDRQSIRGRLMQQKPVIVTDQLASPAASPKAAPVQPAPGIAPLQNAVQEPAQQTTVHQWTAQGGLSLKMELPSEGHQLTFSKVGGSPVLSVSVHPRNSRSFILKSAFSLLILIVGFYVIRKCSYVETSLRCVSLVLVIVGIAGLMTTIGMAYHWLFLIIFCVGLVLNLIQRCGPLMKVSNKS